MKISNDIKKVVATVRMLLLFVLMALQHYTYAQKTFTNPIIAGAYPDPSICKVGDDYYLVNSSFEYFPGIPVWHSKDLVHWELVSNAISQLGQFNFDGIASSAGAWAPTIRFHKGIYYIAVTWVDWRMKVGFKNVLLTAKSPAGPWAGPYTITDSIWGIDPALFFDDNGKAYCLMNHPAVGFKHDGASSIMLQEIDLEKMKLIGKPGFIGRGAMLDSKYPEGPKMFKKDGFYYLLIAEGGTGEFHAVTVSRSKNITGPYENFGGNPILTHRAMGYTTPFINIGHADLVQTGAGEWWMVCLGSRPLAGNYNILGRETFLVPVQWNKGAWPIVSPGYGQVRPIETAPTLPLFEVKPTISRDDFNESVLSPGWTFIRTPSDFYSLTAKQGHLLLNLSPHQLSQKTSPSFVGKRLLYRSGTIQTQLSFHTKQPNEEAGLVLYKSDQAWLKFVINAGHLKIIVQKDSMETVLNAVKISKTSAIELRIRHTENLFSFSYKTENDAWTNTLINWDAGLLSVEQSGGFMGTLVGLYAGSNGIKSKNKASFDWFDYRLDLNDK